MPMLDKPFPYDERAASPIKQETAYGALGTTMGQNAASREMTAQEVITERLHDLYEEARQLEALSKCLPMELPWAANRALCEMLRLRRTYARSC